MHRGDNSNDVFVTSNRYSYLSKMGDECDRWILRTPVYAIDRRLRLEDLRSQLLAVIERNDALRLTLRSHQAIWIQRVGPPTLVLEHVLHAADLGGETYRDVLNDILESLRATMTLAERNLVFVAIEEKGGRRYHLVALFHHVLMDGVALARFEQEIAEAIAGASEGPAGGSRWPYRDYCLSYERRCRALLEASTNYWLDLPWRHIDRVPSIRDVGPDAMDHQWSLETCLAYSAAAFAEVRRDAARAGQASIAAALIVSFAEAYGIWADAEYLLLGLVHHNRSSDASDFIETIGWMSETVPLLLPTRGPVANRLRNADHQLAMVRQFGASYGYNRHLSAVAAVREVFGRHPTPDISLNLALGRPRRTRSLPIDVHEHRALTPIGKRVHPIAGGVRIKNGRLLISLDHSHRMLPGPRVEALLRRFDEALDRTLRSMSCAPLQKSVL